MESSKHALAPGSRRRAGVCLHLTSLPGPHGIGGIGRPAQAFVRTLAAAGVSVWQFLPTGPTAFGNSPYQPLSVFAGNELLIDVDALIDDGLIGHRDAEPLAALAADTVDFDKLIPAKTTVLLQAAGNFRSGAEAESRAAFDAFVARNDATWLHDYARFRVLKTMHGEAAWTDWDRCFRRRYVRSLQKLDREAAPEIERVKILQFLFDRQWLALRSCAAEHGVTLFGDAPIYLAADSADAWSRPDLLEMDRDGAMPAVAGVPPDYFGVDGQRWGNPLYRWRRHAREDFGWWTSRIRRALALADLVRIDHFRGLEAYWSVPADAASARDGRWVRGPGDALFRALENALGELPIVAEDLGEITPAVTALRRRFGIPGMQVLQFALQDQAFGLADIDEDCVCYTGTHDNNTTIGWFRGKGNDRRRSADNRRLQARVLALTGGSAATVHIDLLRLALESRARLAIAPMQDVLGLGPSARLNTPGKAAGNWRWRMTDDALTGESMAGLGELVARSGRSAT